MVAGRGLRGEVTAAGDTAEFGVNPPEILAVTICATARYQYALTAQARAVAANLGRLTVPVHIVLVGDSGLKPIDALYRELLPGDNFRVHVDTRFTDLPRPKDGEDPNNNYQPAAQLLIARMRTAAFAKARALGATMCWSLDSDVIPGPTCLENLSWLLRFDRGYYGVAISPYVSQGGGGWLAGRGTPQQPILPDWLPEERDVPKDLRNRLEQHQKKLLELKEAPSPELLAEGKALHEAVEKSPPKGDVFSASSGGKWRRRGWLDQAYPALGRGAIVPSDWCGFGNTLLSDRALLFADFLGYDGKGTEDLFVVWKRWHQQGIRIGACLHELSGHVIRRKDGSGYVYVAPRYETEGETVGHIRAEHRPWYPMDATDKFDPSNDGRLS